MKMLSYGLTAILLVTGLSQLHAQDKTMQDLSNAAQKKITIEDTSHKDWRLGGIFHLNLSQGALSHWAAGGDKASFALTGLFNGYASYSHGKSIWDNLLDMAYGYTKTSSTSYRKSDDHFYFTSQYGYQATKNKKWYYSALLDFKTQFTEGYLYDEDGHKTFNSDLFSPAYLLISAGMNFKPTNYFNIYLSPITERWTFVLDDTLSARGEYGVTPGSHSYNELGAFVSARLNKDFGKAVNLTSRLDLFSNYKHDPQNVDVYFTNLLTLKVTKYLATTISLNMIYDDDVKFPAEDDPDKKVAHLQIQEVLGIGFSYKF